MQNTWAKSLAESEVCIREFRSHEANLKACAEFSRALADTVRAGGNLFSCGNGGSHCDAMHFAEELTGRYRDERRPIGALALGDASHTTCVSNDYGFEHVFSRQLAGLGRPGDFLLGLSTSGNSQNVILAFETARKLGVRTVALLGKGGGKLKDLADLAIVVPGESSDRIQEIHIKIIHIAIEALERELFPGNYAFNKGGMNT